MRTVPLFAGFLSILAVSVLLAQQSALKPRFGPISVKRARVAGLGTNAKGVVKPFNPVPLAPRGTPLQNVPLPGVLPGQAGRQPLLPGIADVQLRPLNPLIYGVGLANASTDIDLARASLLAAKVKALSATCVRFDIRWADVERVKGRYDWAGADGMVRLITGMGLTPICSVSASPDWAVDPDGKALFVSRGMADASALRAPSPKHYADLTRFAGALATRYRTQVRYWEFWPDPDGAGMPVVDRDTLGRPSGIRYGDPRIYADMLQAFSMGVKRADPQMRVAIGGLTVLKTDFLCALYDNGARPFFDAVALHPCWDRNPVPFEWVDQCHTVLVEHGDTTKTVWLSEWGWATAPEKPGGVSLQHQARLVKETLSGMRDRAFIELAAYCGVSDWRSNPQDPRSLVSSGLATYGLAPKPAFAVFRDVASGTPIKEERTFAKVALIGALPRTGMASSVQVTVHADRPGPLLPPPLAGVSQSAERGGTDFVPRLAARIRELGVKMVRFDPFPSPDMVRRESVVGAALSEKSQEGPFSIDWRYADDMLDAIRSGGARPMISLGTMPTALSAPAGNPRMPRDLTEWGAFVGTIVRHVQARSVSAGAGGPAYWELGEEPDRGDYAPEEYVRLYGAFARAVVAMDPAARVGGPATSGANVEWHEALAKECARKGIPLHFLTWHAYDIPADEILQRSHDLKKVAATAGIRDAEVLLTEWNLSSRRTPEHDSVSGAVRVLTTLATVQDATEVRPLIYELKEGHAVRDDGAELRGGWGLLTWDDQPKPVYQAIQLLSHVAGRRLPIESEDGTVHARAAQGSDGRLSVLVWRDGPNAGSTARPIPVTLDLQGLAAKGELAGACTSLTGDPDGAAVPTHPNRFRARGNNLEVPVILSGPSATLVEVWPAAPAAVDLSVSTPHYQVFPGSRFPVTVTLKNRSTAAHRVTLDLSESDPQLIPPSEAKNKPIPLAPGGMENFTYVVTAPISTSGDLSIRARATAGAERTDAAVSIHVADPFAARLEGAGVDVARPGGMPDSLQSTAKARVALENRTDEAMSVALIAGRATESVTIPAQENLAASITVAAPSTEPGNYVVPIRVLNGQSAVTLNARVGVPAVAAHARRKPRLAGELLDWADAQPISLPGPPQGLDHPWKGVGDLSARAYVMWDEQYLYVAALVNDDIDYHPFAARDMERADSLVVGLAGNRAADPDRDALGPADIAFGIMEREGGSCSVYVFGGGAGREGEKVRASVHRTDRQTFYEATIPWSVVGKRVSDEDAVGLAILVNDSDGAGRNYLQWGSGLSGGKRPGQFNPVRLARER